MERWKDYYKERLCTAEEAVRMIHSGDHVVFSHCAAEPLALINAMVKNHNAYKGVTISHMQTLGTAEYARPEYKENFIFEGYFLSNYTRACVAEGRGDTVPNYYHEAPQWLRSGTWKVDVMLAMVSPPDEKGYVCCGVSADYTRAAFDAAKLIIAQVNEYMPVTYGDTKIHISKIAAFVEHSQPLVELPPPHMGDAELAIGEHCSSLIPDGATISLGIGSIPDAVCRCLTNKKDLGIFTDMFSDGILDLCESGVLNCSKASTHKDLMVTSFVMGTKRLYDYVDRNPFVLFKGADYVNHPYMIARQSNMVIINACVGVDFMGQVVSASLGKFQFSGVGGQPSLARGAAMSFDRKGKSIIATTATVKDLQGNTVSRITPYIAHGAEVTMTREDVDYVITEYGIAKLKGKPLAERARALIGIAAPQFRDELKEAFERRFLRKF